jgi:hypothetical protein
MKLVIDYHEDHHGYFHDCVLRVIGGNWNERPFPAVAG